MRAFVCHTCGQLVFFENTSCLRCGSPLAVDPVRQDVVVVDDPALRCVNAVIAGCNWLAEHPGFRCYSCYLTRTRPADGDPALDGPFVVAEAAKRRLVFQLLTLGIELEPRDEGAGTGVAFDLLSSVYEPVTTGHAGGVITLDLAESDDVHRESIRTKLREPYRTVLGHLRHEIGHYAFLILVGDHELAEARALFGDETVDYQQALDRHYTQGAPAGWGERFISEYATMHPAEDFAETFAHYLHVHDVLQTAAAYRVRVDGPQLASGVTSSIELASSPAEVDTSSMAAIVATWLPLSYALNAVNRSMGVDDLYPFVLPAPVIDKLAFVHHLISRLRTSGPGSPVPAG